MKQVVEVKTQVETRNRVEIDGRTIIEMLRNTGMAIPNGAAVNVVFLVPGGGDWSDCTVDVDASNPVHVMWTTTESREETR